MHRFSRHPLPLLACLLLSLSITLQAAPPEPIAPKKEANRLTSYERKVLTLEMQRLTGEVQSSAKQLAEHPDFATYQEAIKTAEGTHDTTQINTAKVALHRAVQDKMRLDPTLSKKIARIGEIGELLRYDTPNRQTHRHQNRPVIYAPSPLVSTNTP